MIAWTPILLAVFGVGVVLTASAVPAGCPPQFPWCPQWVTCNYTEVQGPSCHDCSTRVICTSVGAGLLRPCAAPTAHCAAGECVADPSQQCAQTTPADTTVQASAGQ